MILQILSLLGSLAMFLFGMSLMSGGLQKMAWRGPPAQNRALI